MEHADAARDEAAFSMRVLQHMSSRGDGLSSVTANLAVSPLSLHAALVLLGASARGATLDQIVAFLGPAGAHAHALLASHVALRVLAADAEAGGPTVRFANGVWIDAALRLTDAYAHQVTEHYLAEVRSVPFKSQPVEATRQMNEWIEAATAGRIKNPIPAGSITTSTQAVLTNALYFNGAWSHKFEPRFTQHHAFYLLNGSHVLVPFMSNTKNQYIARRCGYKVLRLPYDASSTATPGSSQQQQRVFSMYIYLPDDYYGLPSLLHNLSSNPSLLESSQTMRKKVPMGAFMVPKFTVSCGTDATETLQALGLKLPFDPVAADLSEMVEAPPEPLVVSKVHHMCFVEVNEEGTEAAAATFFNPVPGCPPMMPADDFVANHPFIFLIKEDRSGVVVFAGQVTNPSTLSP